MKRVLFIQNGEYDSAGLFATVLQKTGISMETVHAWNGEKVPPGVEGWDAIAVGGGAMSAYQTAEYPFLKEEISLLEKARAKSLPVIGMCLGAQLMAAAFGGDVFPNHEREIGFYEVHFTKAAERDPLWQGCTQPLQPVHWHQDTFSLPPDAVRLASSELTTNQLFRLDESLYGLQFHLEIDRPLLAEMVLTEDGGGLPKYGIDPHEFLRAGEKALPNTERVAGEIFTRWTGMLA